MKVTGQVNKIYCFVDETGQDTGGKLFLVAVVISNSKELEELDKLLKKTEQDTGKLKRKWGRLNFKTKAAYIKVISQVKILKQSIYYSVYENTKSYSPLLALTIAKSINQKVKTDYQASIIIDGLTEGAKDTVRRELKLLKVKYHNIKGLKDEQSAILRLADSMAGLFRDHYEKQSYTKKLYELLTSMGRVVKI